jgi:hypothetical protein
MRVLRLLAWLGGAAAITASIAGCSGSKGDARTFQCSPSKPSRYQGAASTSIDSPASFNYGNKSIRAALPPHGHLVAGRLPGGGSRATINKDGSISAKFGWWRGLRGTLMISGNRLDASAAPLKAELPPMNSYDVPGFIPSGLTFPTTGCWRVSARLGRAHLSFVLSVTTVRH